MVEGVFFFLVLVAGAAAGGFSKTRPLGRPLNDLPSLAMLLPFVAARRRRRAVGYALDEPQWGCSRRCGAARADKTRSALWNPNLVAPGRPGPGRTPYRGANGWLQVNPKASRRGGTG